MARQFQGDPEVIAKILEARIRKKFASLTLTNANIKKAFIDVANLIVTQAKLNVVRQGLVDFGHLRDSLRWRFIRPGLIEMGSFGIPYARIHEFGGTITPVTKQWLTIPTEQFKNQRARDLPNLFFVQKSASKAMLFQKSGDGPPVLAFNLRKRVEIKAKPYLAPAIQTQRDRAIEILQKAVRENLGGN